MKERILFIPVGQGGGNVGQILEQMGYNCLFINTSYDDLKTIEAKHKFHIAGTFGCNRDRKKALKYVKESHETISQVIEKRFPQQDLIYFIFTGGGGTGSGLSPILLDIMSRKNPNKYYSAIMILPNVKEGLKPQINAIEAFQDLAKVENLRSVMILDNNNVKDKFELNTRFAKMFDILVNITIPNPKGVIDTSELETLMTCKGSMYLCATRSVKQSMNTSTNLPEDILNSVDSNIFTQFEAGSCKYLGISKCGEVEDSDMDALVGTPVDTFVGYNNKFNFTIMAGLPYPKARIKELIENVNKEQNKIEAEQKRESELDFFGDMVIPTLRVDTDYKPNISSLMEDMSIAIGESEYEIEDDIEDGFEDIFGDSDLFKKGEDEVSNNCDGVISVETPKKKKKISIDDIFERYE